MGIRFYCPKGHKLNVKEFQAGRRGICPYCGEKILIPVTSSRPSSREERRAKRAGVKALAAVASGTAVMPADGLETKLPLQQGISARDESQNNGQAASIASAGPAPIISRSSENVAEILADRIPLWDQSSSAPAPSLQASGVAAMPDPLADSAEVVWYVRPPSGGQFGPATPEIIRGWLAEGRISSDTLVWREGWRDWLEAGCVFPQLNLALVNPIAALNIPPPTDIIPQRTPATPAPAVKPRIPQAPVWMIATLGVFTLLAIAGLIWFLSNR